MSNLLMLTASFPYEGGEQFIEPEINFWGESSFNKKYILPETGSVNKRYYPDNICLLNDLINRNKHFIFIFIFISFFSSIFWKEIKYLVLKRDLNFAIFFSTLFFVARVLFYKLYLKKIVKRLKGEILIYSYWNDIGYYASCLLKKEYKRIKIISRAHGFDLYEERRKFSYMPLKRQFKDNAEKIYLLSESALAYYRDRYSYSEEKLDISRLGVFLPNKIKYFNSDKKTFTVLSLSSCIPLKRVDKIIDAIYQFSVKNNIRVNWVHIGDGVLFDQLKNKTKKLSDLNNNFNGTFLGQLSNKDVHEWLSITNVDVIINASESEGVPVSLMEAMSYGIPAIAPDIGGISTLIVENNGYLMSSAADVYEIIMGLETIFSLQDVNSYRNSARNMIDRQFNAEKNYKAFVSQAEKMIENE